MNRIALSVDIEDWYHSRHILSNHNDPNGAVTAFRHEHQTDYLTAPINNLLELFAEHDVKATFFIVADLIERYGELFKSISRAGHEIACHGLHHIEYRGLGGAEELNLFLGNTLQAKKRLEDLVGKSVIGFRAPSAYFSQWMVRPLVSMGFLYDSSVAINSLYRKTDVVAPRPLSRPFFLPAYKNAAGHAPSIFEIPWPSWQLLGLKIPVGGGPTLRLFGAYATIKGLEQSLHSGDSAFYIHPHDICYTPLPKVIRTKRRLFWRNRGRVAWARYKRVLARFASQCCSCEQIYANAVPNMTQATDI